jgi:hypothetical protein
MRECDDGGMKKRGKACESGWDVRDIPRKVSTSAISDIKDITRTSRS